MATIDRPGETGQSGKSSLEAATADPMRMPPRLKPTFKTSVRGIARENASIIKARGTRKSRQLALENGPAGDGLPVVLIPGFLTGDWSMRLMASTLRAWDFTPFKSGISLNVGCTNDLVDRLADRVRIVAARTNRQVAIVGWSRGGTLAKLIAIRQPQDLAGIVTLVSPNGNPLAVSNVVVRQLKVLNRLHALGASGVMGEDCIHGECALSVEEQLNQPFPESVPYVSMYTQTDGVVDWRACLDTDASQLIEVDGTHLGVGNDVRVIRQIAAEMAGFPAAKTVDQ